MPTASEPILQVLRELTARTGSDPLLTQASTGNSSAKLDGTLWIKASGKWMADAMRDNIFVPLRLNDVTKCLCEGLDPIERFPAASLETAMHAALPHRFVLHLHSVDAIAWAVRKDALHQLKVRLKDLRWQWIPYMASGLPLSREIERVLALHSDTELFVLGNHGLVLGNDDAAELECLLLEVQRRLVIAPRCAQAADYPVLEEICASSQWSMPNDDAVHALGTDVISQEILSRGLLYPCQAIFAGSEPLALFRAIRYFLQPEMQYADRPFLLVDKCGLLVNQSIQPAELAMISGLAQVVQRLSASAPIRYLTDGEVAELSGEVAYRYRGLANANQSDSAEAPRPSC